MIGPILFLLFGVPQTAPPPDEAAQLLSIKRVYVDRLTGGDSAAQLRDLIIASLQNTRLFVITENQDRADAVIVHESTGEAAWEAVSLKPIANLPVFHITPPNYVTPEIVSYVQSKLT